VSKAIISKGKKQKAWELVKDSLQDEDAYHKLRNGFPIQLMGSSGTLYFLYPSGRFVKVGLEQPVIGKMVKGSYYASPDYLATIISWIRFNEEQLEKNWNCGNFHMQEPVTERVRERQVHRHYARRRDNSDWMIPIALVLVSVVGIWFLAPQITTLFEGSLVASEGAEAGTGAFSDVAQSMIDLTPLMLPFLMIGIFLQLFMRDHW